MKGEERKIAVVKAAQDACLDDGERRPVQCQPGAEAEKAKAKPREGLDLAASQAAAGCGCFFLICRYRGGTEGGGRREGKAMTMSPLVAFALSSNAPAPTVLAS